MSSNEKLVRVYRAANEMEAEVIKGLLESGGLPCLLRMVPSSTANIYTGVSLAQVDILVPASRAEEAEELIRSQAEGDTEANNDE